MKVITPEISWHEREPIYSVDFQPGSGRIRRVASGGVDKIVRVWQFDLDEEGKGKFEFLSNLRRHTATVNVVRFSKKGAFLASAGDDTTIILWKLSDISSPANNIFAEDGVEEDKETWVCHKALRGHLGDIADLSWSKDDRYLVSGSVDNSAIVWDIVKDQKVAIFNEHKSYVQGVAVDPLGDLVATLSSDRSLRIYNLHSKNCLNNVSKMVLPSHLANTNSTTDQQNVPSDVKPKPFRIFHDDSLRSFFRRLEFSPDGQLLMTPAGCMEHGDGKLINASFIFARGAFSKPAVSLPSVAKSTTVVRVNPQLFQLRPVTDTNTNGDTTSESPSNQKDWEKNKSLFCLPYRVVFSVATEDSVIIYDTQQSMPVGLLKNIHYHQISDMSWSQDGKALIISSIDGFCTVATFEDNELGVPYTKREGRDKRVSSLVKECPESNMEVDTEESLLTNSQRTPLPFSNYSKPQGTGKEMGSREKPKGKRTLKTQNSQDKKEDSMNKVVAETNKDISAGKSNETVKLLEEVAIEKGTPEEKPSKETEILLETLNVTEKSTGNTPTIAQPKKRAQLTTLSLNDSISSMEVDTEESTPLRTPNSQDKKEDSVNKVVAETDRDINAGKSNETDKLSEGVECVVIEKRTQEEKSCKETETPKEMLNVTEKSTASTPIAATQKKRVQLTTLSLVSKK